MSGGLSAFFPILGIVLAVFVFAPEMDATESIGNRVLQDNPIPRTEESVSAGRVVYARYCRACHGRGGKGDGGAAPPGSQPSNLLDNEWDYGETDAEIFKTIWEGVPPDMVMAAWGERISEEDTWNVVNYLRDLAESAFEEEYSRP